MGQRFSKSVVITYSVDDRSGVYKLQCTPAPSTANTYNSPVSCEGDMKKFLGRRKGLRTGQVQAEVIAVPADRNTSDEISLRFIQNPSLSLFDSLEHMHFEMHLNDDFVQNRSDLDDDASQTSVSSESDWDEEIQQAEDAGDSDWDEEIQQADDDIESDWDEEIQKAEDAGDSDWDEEIQQAEGDIESDWDEEIQKAEDAGDSDWDEEIQQADDDIESNWDEEIQKAEDAGDSDWDEEIQQADDDIESDWDEEIQKAEDAGDSDWDEEIQQAEGDIESDWDEEIQKAEDAGDSDWDEEIQQADDDIESNWDEEIQKAEDAGDSDWDEEIQQAEGDIESDWDEEIQKAEDAGDSDWDEEIQQAEDAIELDLDEEIQKAEVRQSDEKPSVFIQEINSCMYEIGEMLGEGGFGAVFAGTRVHDGLEVAVKYAKKSKHLDYISIPGHPEPLPREVALHMLACEGEIVPEIIRLLDWQDYQNRYVMVLERPSPCEDLSEFIASKGAELEEELARVIMRQATTAAYMSCERGVFHRDIKLDNLLIRTDTMNVKLIDFGCGDLLKKSTYKSYTGTINYVCPEYFETGEYRGKPSTVYSLGVLLFAMLCRRFPSDFDLHLINEKTWSEDGLTEECCGLLQACLQQNPDERIHLENIRDHAWFEVSQVER